MLFNAAVTIKKDSTEEEWQFNNCFIQETETTETTTNGSVRKKQLLLYIFNDPASLSGFINDADITGIRSGLYALVNSSGYDNNRKYSITSCKKCLYGSMSMQHLELYLE